MLKDFLSQLIKHNVKNNPRFKYHWQCDKLQISHLCFADDLLLLFHGDLEYANVMKDSLAQFYDFTRLLANNDKSNLFFSGTEEHIANVICQELHFNKGTFPVKYLGVPLITSKLKKSDCDDFVNKISSHLLSWTSKSLSYTGRLQLIQSVIARIQNYWAELFILPKSVLKQVESLIRRFLWTGGIDKAHGAKVAWEAVCKPKKEGGLGLKNLAQLNNVLNLKHIWNIF